MFVATFREYGVPAAMRTDNEPPTSFVADVTVRRCFVPHLLTVHHNGTLQTVPTSKLARFPIVALGLLLCPDGIRNENG